VQVAEQQRIAELRKSDPALAAQLEGAADASQKSTSLMPEPTRETLKRITAAMRKASGAAEPDSPPAPAAPASPGSAPARTPPDRKAEAPAGDAPPPRNAGLSPAIRMPADDPQRLTP
jgi:penicillin-binding protein 1A